MEALGWEGGRSAMGTMIHPHPSEAGGIHSSVSSDALYYCYIFDRRIKKEDDASAVIRGKPQTCKASIFSVPGKGIS